MERSFLLEKEDKAAFVRLNREIKSTTIKILCGFLLSTSRMVWGASIDSRGNKDSHVLKLEWFLEIRNNYGMDGFTSEL